jgi:uncharacterized protein
MSVLRPILAACLAVAMLAAAPQLGAQTFPDPVSTTVNDFADLLPETDERALVPAPHPAGTRDRRRTDRRHAATQADFAPDMTLEAYATALFDHWGVGKAETNDGVMVLVFRDDRAMRLELGAAYGRDWDRVAQDVLERHFLNAFATGDYVRGLTWGTEQTIERIVLPFREGAAPPGRRFARLDHRDRHVRGRPSGHVAPMDRRPAGAPAPLPAMRPPGAAPDRSVLTAATGALPGTGERIRTCRYCDFEERDSYHIPVRRASSRAAPSAADGQAAAARRDAGRPAQATSATDTGLRLPADHARAASPKARKSGRLTGSCAARYSGCHCTDRVKPGAPST